MSYFSPYLDKDGIHMPTYLGRLDDLTEGYRRIFGQDVYLSEDAPDYQLLSLIARAMDDMNAVIVDVYNARSPVYAADTSLDALLPLSGIRRYGATYATATLTLTGTPGATLPSGMQARDTAGHVWRIASPVTFSEDGTADALATCQTIGSITADAGTISSIDTPTGPWMDVTNAAPAIPGRDVETDAAVRVRRALSVSLPSRSIIEGVRAAIANLQGVTHVSVLENSGAISDDNGLPAHSVCAIVSGGDNGEVARMIFLKKAPGVATYGNTNVTHTDDYGLDHTVSFSRPVQVPVTVAITLKPLAGWDESTMNTAIPSAISAYVDSLGIGENLIVSALYGCIFSANQGNAPTFSVLSVTAAATGQTATSDTITAAYDRKLTTDASHITLTVQEG